MDAFNYSVLHFFEIIRNPVLDAVMSVVTYLGHEAVFLAVAMLIFWCVDKRRGYYVMASCFISLVATEVIKIFFMIPRPWIRFADKNFTIVESAREAATGYSFPSGHTANATSVGTTVLRFAKNRAVKIIAITVMCLVPISRMYLGVHTPADVVASLIIAAAISLALYPLFELTRKKPGLLYILLLAFFGISVLLLLFALLWPFPEGIDPANLNELRKTAFTLIGATTGVVILYPIENKYIRFSTEATLPGQIVKLALGVGVVMGVKEGLKAFFKLFADENTLEFMWLRSVRYFAVVLVAMALYPMLFRFFANIGKKKEARRASE